MKKTVTFRLSDETREGIKELEILLTKKLGINCNATNVIEYSVKKMLDEYRFNCPSCGANGSSVDEIKTGIFKCHECLKSFEV